MFGLVIVLVAMLCIAFASYKLGNGMCETDLDKRDADRNASLVVVALGVMFLLCGVLASMSGSWNPFNALTSSQTPTVVI